MRLLLPYACVLAAVLGADPVVETSRPAHARQPDTVKNLQDKRLAVLKEIVEVTEKTYKGGQASFDQVGKARLDLLQAQLDMSRTKEERVRVLEEMVKQTEALEEVVKKLVEAKQAGRIDALKAEALVLQIKIALEQAKAAKGP